MKAFGVTGGIGAGKSVATRIFEILGISIYDADSRARGITSSSSEVRKAITQLFGEASYHDHQLDRAYVAKIVFHDPEKLEQLNAIIHPAVAHDFEDWLGKQAGPYVLKEAALLYETGSYKDLDAIIVVDAPTDVRKQRVLLRDPHRDASQVEAIMNKQMDSQEKAGLADYLIVNDGHRPLIPQVLDIHQRLCTLP